MHFSIKQCAQWDLSPQVYFGRQKSRYILLNPTLIARAFDFFIELVDLQTMRIADLVSQARVVGLPWVCVLE